jgi:hypothetical protein
LESLLARHVTDTQRYEDECPATAPATVDTKSLLVPMTVRQDAACAT